MNVGSFTSSKMNSESSRVIRRSLSLLVCRTCTRRLSQILACFDRRRSFCGRDRGRAVFRQPKRSGGQDARLGKAPEIVAVEQLDANFAPAFGIVTAIDDTGLHSVGAIPPAENERATSLNRMTADERCAVLANRNCP